MIGLYLNFIDKTKSKIRRKRRKCTSTVNKLENKRFKNKCNLVSQSIYNWTWILFYSFFWHPPKYIPFNVDWVNVIYTKKEVSLTLALIWLYARETHTHYILVEFEQSHFYNTSSNESMFMTVDAVSIFSYWEYYSICIRISQLNLIWDTFDWVLFKLAVPSLHKHREFIKKILKNLWISAEFHFFIELVES